MASSAVSPRNWRDTIYVAFFSIALFSNLFVDLIPTLLEELDLSPSSPLNALLVLRRFYTSTYNDLFLSTPWAQQPSFFQLFTLLELLYQLPASVWILRRFSRDSKSPVSKTAGNDVKGGTSPALELACLVYGVQCALTTLACIWDCIQWEGKVYTWAVKRVLIFQLYTPFLILPLGMAVDMWVRLLARFDNGAAKKTQ